MSLPSQSYRFLVALLVIGACRPATGGHDGAPIWPDSLPVAAEFGARRDWSPARAILHVHSVFSHDACDKNPQDAAERPNEPCLKRFRAALCQSNVDAAFLTEHDRYLVRADSVAEALSLRTEDQPVHVNGRVVATQLACGTLLYPGAENALMPIGFDSLPLGTREERRSFYDAKGFAAADDFRNYGAVVLLSHTEDHLVSEIEASGPDAIEIVNPHAVFAPKHRRSQGLSRLGAFLQLMPFLLRQTPAHPDLAYLAIFRSNDVALEKWDRLLADRMVFGFGASDAHENSIPWSFSDGDRGDSYERMIPWVTNVVFIPTAGSKTVAERTVAIEDAVRAGHFFVVVEAWGTPSGFDFRLEGPHGVAEMGSTIGFRDSLRLVAVAPTVAGLGEGHATGRIAMQLYRIDPTGARELVVESTDRIDAPVVKPGTYRVEVTVEPRHLAPYLGIHARELIREVDWIYSNPIRVVAAPRPVAQADRAE